MFAITTYRPRRSSQPPAGGSYARGQFAGRSSDEFRRQGFWPLLQRHLERGKRYLDAGCGLGGWILFLSEEGYDVEGIDSVAPAVRALSDFDPDLRVKVASLTDIPYPDAQFDGVLSIGTLEYLEGGVVDALQEVSRVVRPGGVFFLEVPIANTLRQLVYIPLKRLESVVRRFTGEVPVFSRYLFGRDELRRLLDQAGFDVVVLQPHDLPSVDGHYGLYVDWPFLRGSSPYHLNVLGKAVRAVCATVSPWVASTGAVVVARKRA